MELSCPSLDPIKFNIIKTHSYIREVAAISMINYVDRSLLQWSQNILPALFRKLDFFSQGGI